MTREDAKNILFDMLGDKIIVEPTKQNQAILTAIKALEQTDVLDKIRAEILDEADYAYADFNLYKEDILNAEPDELPDDDFRFGMKRAAEIIDKYRKGGVE